MTVKSATSYENIRTVDGILYDTFHQACLALGLIEDDTEWERALTEGEIWMMPRQLRNLFTRILIHCQPNNPSELWEKFKDSMFEDFRRSSSTSQSYSKAYREIHSLLTDNGYSLDNFPMMPPLAEFEIIVDGITNEMSNQYHEDIGRAQYNKLNTKQKGIVNIILNAISDERPLTSCFYIDGPGGSGKTFVYTTLYHLLKSKEKNIITTAFTGIAASRRKNYA